MSWFAAVGPHLFLKNTNNLLVKKILVYSFGQTLYLDLMFSC